MIYRYFLIFLLALPLTTHAQNKVDPSEIINKNIPEVIKKEIRAALAYYPELARTKIDFKFKDNLKNAFMVAQPKWYGVFQGKKKRAYTIKMGRTFKLMNKEVPIENLPEGVLKGWIAHELGHIMDYSHRSGISMIGFGFSYLTSSRFMISAEEEADVQAIDHGLGNLLILTKHFILEHEDIPKNYKKRIKKFYMSPEMVTQIIEAQHDETIDNDGDI